MENRHPVDERNLEGGCYREETIATLPRLEGVLLLASLLNFAAGHANKLSRRSFSNPESLVDGFGSKSTSG